MRAYFILLTFASTACATTQTTRHSVNQVTISGIAAYRNGAPAPDALIAIMDSDTGAVISTFSSDEIGKFAANVPSGGYTLTATTPKGFALVESTTIPSDNLHLLVSEQCHAVHGQVDGGSVATRVILQRQSGNEAEAFVTPLRPGGKFSACVLEGKHHVWTTGDAISAKIAIDVPTSDEIRIRSWPIERLKTVPAALPSISANIDTLVEDVRASHARIIGMGEATHGTAEFVSARGALTFELIRRAGVRAILFEFDSIAGIALDDYVNGVDVDIGKAVNQLRFWITDTHDFIGFLRQLREYNATAKENVHIWGVDLQYISPPIGVLVAHADELSLTPHQITIMNSLVDKRGQAVTNMLASDKADLDALLQRLARPRSKSREDLLIAVAARSLAMQLEYWIGDMGSWYELRRDVGLAKMANFITSELDAPRVCLWAHNTHTSKRRSELKMGGHLADSPLGYYAIGFYQYSGSTRAWDPASKIGVISHNLPPVSYTAESVFMEASGKPEIAWIPLRRLSGPLADWLRSPRFVREVTAVYVSEEDSLRLRDIPVSFDALAVIKTGHDSSPTPTGVRVAP